MNEAADFAEYVLPIISVGIIALFSLVTMGLLVYYLIKKIIREEKEDFEKRDY